MTECVHCGAVDDEEGGIVVGLLGELNEPTCNICQAELLKRETVLKRRESEVYALKQLGYTHARIAEILDIAKATVDTYSSRANDRIRRAESTVSITRP